MNTGGVERKQLKRVAKQYMRSVPNFVRLGTGIRLRPYQTRPLGAILNSIDKGLGLSFVIVFPRQSGKDELMANLKIYLMCILSPWEHSIVEVNPTYKPQTINAIMRLEVRMNLNPLTYTRWRKRSDFIRQIGMCRTSFLSGDGQANVVGATASVLLIINEAQDILPAIYDKKFAPMCASTNATKIFCGTVWTSNTLLAREMRVAKKLQAEDGIRRLFMVDADVVSKYHKPYGLHVAERVGALGRQNPMVKTQYFNEEIDAQAGMFNTNRRALMLGDQEQQDVPVSGHIYAILVDVGGQDEALLNLEGLGNPGRDFTTATIVDIDLSMLDTYQAPIYRVVARRSWQGVNHMVILGQLAAAAAVWRPIHIVIDATGVGEGLWAMMDKAYPGKVIPVKFSQGVKSEIGWGFLAVIESGRFRDCAPMKEVDLQYSYCQSEILPGPSKTLRWGVKDGTRDPATGELVHDDYVVADSLVSQLDKLEWVLPTEAVIVEAADPLLEMSRI